MPERILIADDDPDMRDVLTTILVSQGYEVVIARDGVEALDNLKTEKPHLIILDLLMPRMDGFAVIKELQNRRWLKYREIPILVLSAVREEASRRRYELETAKTLNIDDYVTKPVSPESLLERVEKLLRGESKT